MSLDRSFFNLVTKRLLNLRELAFRLNWLLLPVCKRVGRSKQNCWLRPNCKSNRIRSLTASNRGFWCSSSQNMYKTNLKLPDKLKPYKLHIHSRSLSLLDFPVPRTLKIPLLFPFRSSRLTLQFKNRTLSNNSPRRPLCSKNNRWGRLKIILEWSFSIFVVRPWEYTSDLLWY